MTKQQTTVMVRGQNDFMYPAKIVSAAVDGIAITKRLPQDEGCRRRYVLTLVDYHGVALGDRDKLANARRLRAEILRVHGANLAKYIGTNRPPGKSPSVRTGWKKDAVNLILGFAMDGEHR